MPPTQNKPIGRMNTYSGTLSTQVMPLANHVPRQDALTAPDASNEKPEASIDSARSGLFSELRFTGYAEGNDSDPDYVDVVSARRQSL
jgi:hypothetical protein